MGSVCNQSVELDGKRPRLEYKRDSDWGEPVEICPEQRSGVALSALSLPLCVTEDP